MNTKYILFCLICLLWGCQYSEERIPDKNLHWGIKDENIILYSVIADIPIKIEYQNGLESYTPKLNEILNNIYNNHLGKKLFDKLKGFNKTFYISVDVDLQNYDFETDGTTIYVSRNCALLLENDINNISLTWAGILMHEFVHIFQHSTDTSPINHEIDAFMTQLSLGSFVGDSETQPFFDVIYSMLEMLDSNLNLKNPKDTKNLERLYLEAVELLKKMPKYGGRTEEWTLRGFKTLKDILQ